MRVTIPYREYWSTMYLTSEDPIVGRDWVRSSIVDWFESASIEMVFFIEYGDEPWEFQGINFVNHYTSQVGKWVHYDFEDVRSAILFKLRWG